MVTVRIAVTDIETFSLITRQDHDILELIKKGQVITRDAIPRVDKVLVTNAVKRSGRTRVAYTTASDGTTFILVGVQGGDMDSIARDITDMIRRRYTET